MLLGIVLTEEPAPYADWDADDGGDDKHADDRSVEQRVRAPESENARHHRANVVRGIPPADEATAQGTGRPSVHRRVAAGAAGSLEEAIE